MDKEQFCLLMRALMLMIEIRFLQGGATRHFHELRKDFNAYKASPVGVVNIPLNITMRDEEEEQK